MIIQGVMNMTRQVNAATDYTNPTEREREKKSVLYRMKQHVTYNL